MTNFWPTVAIVVIVLIVFGAMWFGWRRRVQRDAMLRPNTSIPVDLGDPRAQAEIFYVATTHHDRPLDRAAVAGLGFRARARVGVFASGVTLQIPGQQTVFFAADAITGVGVATWTIDRVVEHDGLVFLAWRAGNDATAKPANILDSYLRVIDPDDRDRIVAAVTAITTPSSTPSAKPTGPADSTESEA